MAGIIKTVGPASANPDYVCDGTNDHEQINQALAWCAANPGNSVYLVGPFIYDIAATLRIGSSTVLTGDSTACCRLNNSCMWASMVPVIGQYGGSGTITTGIEIYGFEIDANESHLTHLGVGSPERKWGKGYYNLIYIQGQSTHHAGDIHIHHMTLHDGMGDGIRLTYCDNIRIHNCEAWNLQHTFSFCIDCADVIDIYDNDVQAITCAGVRLDNSINWKVHSNNIRDWLGTTSAPKGGAYGVQFGNQPSGHTTQTQNGEVYNNTINCGGCGIQAEDYLKSAGSNAQSVKIHHNLISGCGWTNWDNYFSGISIYSWGNGLVIQKNTITGSYRAGILVTSAITSGVKALVSENNILLTVKAGGEGGYGIWNKKPTMMSIVAENNYLTSNISGNYFNVTPVSESNRSIDDAVPDDNGNEDPDAPEDDLPDDIPPERFYQRDTERNYYIDGRTGYINGKPFNWVQKKVDVSNSLGQDTSPGSVGYALTDFELEGAELTLDCQASTEKEADEAIAALCQLGRSTIELGGDFSDWQASGCKGTYSSDLKLQSVIPKTYHPYSLLLVMDLPYFESVIQRHRSRKIYNSLQFNAADTYTGNMVSNSSFENWTPGQDMTWVLQTTAADNDWKKVRYAKEISQFCAIANTGTNNRVMIQNSGESWRIPYSLANNNKNNNWGGLAWCSEWLLWVAMSSSGLSGYGCMISPDGDAWTAKATPVEADGNAWSNCLWIPMDGESIVPMTEDGKVPMTSDGFVPKFISEDGAMDHGRVIAFARSGSKRVIFSDDMCESWTLTLSADETAEWISSAHSPSLKRIVVVAYTGQIMYSDSNGDPGSWALSTVISQRLTSIVWADALNLFVISTEDGDNQIWTSPTGLPGTWVAQETPYSTIITGGTGELIRSLSGDSPVGWNYTTPATSYEGSNGYPSLQYTFVLPVLTNGHIYRIENVHCQLRIVSTGPTASMKVTVQFDSGAETTVAEWTEKNIKYQQKNLDINVESEANQAATIRFYLKTSSGSVRAGATVMGYRASERTVPGGTIIYIRNQLQELVWAPELKMLVAVANSGTGNRVMFSTNATTWLFGVSAADLLWSSICYAGDINKFMSVAMSGTGKRVMCSDSYGSVTNVAPNSWVAKSEGQSRSDLSIEGVNEKYSLQVTGDGETEYRGVTEQPLVFESGVRYLLFAYGRAESLTTGNLAVDVCVGSSTVKSLIWDANTDWVSKKASFKFDVAPANALIRISGHNLNMGAVVNCDSVLVEKASDFELGETGTDVATYGPIDTVPDVVIVGIVSDPESASTGEIITKVTSLDDIYSSISTVYSTAEKSLKWTITLPALTGNNKYRLDQLSCLLKATNGGAAWMKITLRAASLFGGKETAIAEWSELRYDVFHPKTYNLPYVLKSASGETVTLRYYMKTSNSAYRAYVMKLKYKFTVVTDSTSSKITTNLRMYNVADTSAVMACCDILYPKYRQEINADGTGSLSYAEDFKDDNYADVAYASSKVSYNSDNKSIKIESGGYITFSFPCKYPVTGVPYITLFCVSGAPQFYIADDSGTNGAPGTFYAIDGNQTTDLVNAEVYRLLDNENNLQLDTKTKYYVKITPKSGEVCEFGCLYEYADTVTVDAERFKVFTGGANTIGVLVDGKSSCITTLRYRDRKMAR